MISRRWVCCIADTTLPVDHANIGLNGMSTLTLNETGSKSLNCTISPSRPKVNISWYVIATDLCDSKKIQIDGHVTYTRSDDDLQSTTSTIELTLNRTYNGCILVCKAENIRYEAVYHNVTLNITCRRPQPAARRVLRNRVVEEDQVNNRRGRGRNMRVPRNIVVEEHQVNEGRGRGRKRRVEEVENTVDERAEPTEAVNQIQRTGSGCRPATLSSPGISMERIRYRARTLLQSGIAPNTQSTYTTAVNREPI